MGTTSWEANDGIGQAPGSELFIVPGLLMEYVEGFSRAELHEKADETEWQYLADRAVDATNGVPLDKAWERGYHLVVVDFG